ncbi:hypothetical protein ACHAXT_002908 [Thalassiosira profunda]
MPSSVFDRLSQQGTAASAARAAKEKEDRETLQRRRAEESAGVSPRHNRTKLQTMRATQDPRLPVVRSPEQKDAFYNRLSKQETASSAAHHQLESPGPVGPKSSTIGNSEVFHRLYATGLKSPRKARHLTQSVAFPQPPLSPKRGKPPPSPGRRKRPVTKTADAYSAKHDMEIKLHILRLNEQLETMEGEMQMERVEEKMNAVKDAHEADTTKLNDEEGPELQMEQKRIHTSLATGQPSLDQSLQAVKDEYEAKVRALEEQIAAMKRTHEEQLQSVQEENNSEQINRATAEGKEEMTGDETVGSDGREREQSGDDDWWR